MKALLHATCFFLVVVLQASAKEPVIVNGDFEEPQISQPFISSVAVPGWTRTGANGDGNLVRVGYSEAGDTVTVAGHGQQFLIMGGGKNSSADARWSTTITGLTTGYTYSVGFMIASEHPVSGATLTVSIVSPPSGTASQKFTISSSPGKPWTMWERKQIKFAATMPTADLVFSVTELKYDLGLDWVTIALVSPQIIISAEPAQPQRPSSKPRAAYKIGGGVSAPVPIYHPEPQYTEEARNAKVEGTVVLFVVVDELGNPWDLRVIRPLGFGLDQKAIEAIQRWKFRPGEKEGQPVPVQATIEVKFRLND